MKLRRCLALGLTLTVLLPCALPAAAALPHHCPHCRAQHGHCIHCARRCALATPCDGARAHRISTVQPIPSPPPTVLALPRPLAFAARPAPATPRDVWAPVNPPTPPPRAISATRS